MLPPRWYNLRPHDGRHELWHTKARFVVLPCGRRSGKSEIAKRKLIAKLRILKTTSIQRRSGI